MLHGRSLGSDIDFWVANRDVSCVKRKMHDGRSFWEQLGAIRLPWEAWCLFRILPKKVDNCVCVILVKIMFYTCACIYHSWKKKEHLISWKCILLWHVLFCQHELSILLANGLWDKNEKEKWFCHLLWLRFSSFIFYFYLLLMLLCMIWNVLHLLSVCGCAGIKIWRAEREWGEENALDGCQTCLFSSFLFWFSFISPLFFTRPVCLSVCSGLFVHLYMSSSDVHPCPYHCTFLSCDEVS